MIADRWSSLAAWRRPDRGGMATDAPGASIGYARSRRVGRLGPRRRRLGRDPVQAKTAERLEPRADALAPRSPSWSATRESSDLPPLDLRARSGSMKADIASTWRVPRRPSRRDTSPARRAATEPHRRPRSRVACRRAERALRSSTRGTGIHRDACRGLTVRIAPADTEIGSGIGAGSDGSRGVLGLGRHGERDADRHHRPGDGRAGGGRVRGLALVARPGRGGERPGGAAPGAEGARRPVGRAGARRPAGPRVQRGRDRGPGPRPRASSRTGSSSSPSSRRWPRG